MEKTWDAGSSYRNDIARWRRYQEAFFSFSFALSEHRGIWGILPVIGLLRYIRNQVFRDFVKHVTWLLTEEYFC